MMVGGPVQRMLQHKDVTCFVQGAFSLFPTVSISSRTLHSLVPGNKARTLHSKLLSNLSS